MCNPISINEHSLSAPSTDLKAQQKGQKTQQDEEQNTLAHHHCPACDGRCREKTKKENEETKAIEN